MEIRELSHKEKQKEKIMKRNEGSLENLCDTIERNILGTTGVPGEDGKMWIISVYLSISIYAHIYRYRYLYRYRYFTIDIYSKIQLSYKKEGNTAICDITDGP